MRAMVRWPALTCAWGSLYPSCVAFPAIMEISGTMKKAICYLGLGLASSAILLPQAVFAGCLPKVTEVSVELPEASADPTTFSLYGECLGSSSLRAVLAQGQMGMFTPLTTEYQDEYTLEAFLPVGDGESEPLPGEYLLKVQYNVSTRWGNWWIDKASWDLTIGNVGPEGPAGPPGAPIGGLYEDEKCEEKTFDPGDSKGVRGICRRDGVFETRISGECIIKDVDALDALVLQRFGGLPDNESSDASFWCGWKNLSDEAVTVEICATALCVPNPEPAD